MMSSQGPNSCGTGANVTGTGVAWSSATGITASDDTRSTAALTGTVAGTRQTQFLVASNFGFTIPSGATIDGVVVEIERSVSSTSGNPKDESVYLTNNASNTGLIGNNKASASVWPTTDAYATYGASNDVWGATLTDSIVNDSGFGVFVRANKDATESSTTVRVDHIRMTVYYTPASPPPPPASLPESKATIGVGLRI